MNKSHGNSHTQIKVAIIEDLRDVRDGLAMLINGTSGFRCVGRFRSVEEASSKMTLDMPNIVLTDIGLPGMNGIEGITHLRQRYPAVSFIALTIYDDDERIFDALCAGACGYLLKRITPSGLIEGIKEAVTGGTPISPEVAGRVLRLFLDGCPAE